MNIKLDQILKFLGQKSIEFTIRGNPQEEYRICSVFSPEQYGFYFLEGEFSLDNNKFKNSLFLVNSKKKYTEGFSFIVVNYSPQILFYEILDFYFREKSNGQICSTAKINEFAIIGRNVQIDSYAVIGNCRIGDGSIIKSHTVINDNCTIGEKVIIEPNCTIGATGMAWVWGNSGEKVTQPQFGGVKIDNNCIIGANTVIVRGSLNENTRIGENTVMAPGCRLGHGCQIGKNVHLANNVITGGNSIIQDNSFLGSSVTLRPKVKLHKNTTVGAAALVIKDTSGEKLTLMGVPAKESPSKDSQSGVPAFNHNNL